MRRFILHPSALIILFPLFAMAAPNDPPAANADSKFSLTVYSTADAGTFDPQEVAWERQMNPAYKIPGYGVVREVRKIPLTAGDNLIKFTDVAAGIDPTTVSFKSLTAPDTTAVLEQNYEYDLVSPDKLLEKYLGKNIIINRKQEPLPNDRTRMPETIEAKLLSFTSDQLVLLTNNKQLPVQIIPRTHDITEIKLFDLQTGLITKPTLVWKLSAQQGGEHSVLVSYQTDNITWRADYTIAVNKDDTAAELSSWVTLVNETGAAFPNAKLRLVAGDVHRLRRQDEPMLFGGGGGGGRGAEPAFKEKAFFEYHLYTLARPTSIANNATKQIELFPAKSNLPVNKTYVYAGLGDDFMPYSNQMSVDRDIRDTGNKKVDVYLQLKNAEKNGLGIPLPAGRIRVYKRDEADQADADPAGTLEFIGEDKIDHTPKDENVMIRVGSAFDIVGEHKQTDFKLDGKTLTESFEIKLRNHKKEAVNVIVKEPMFRWSQWQIMAASEKYEKHDSRTIYIPMEVGGDQERAITYTVKYTW